MLTETKQFIETNINRIESNIAYAYLTCPLRILNDFNNSMHIAGLGYPSEIHVYVVVCCYISTRVKGIMLKEYDFDYTTEAEEYEFTCDGCPCSAERLNHDLSVLLPERDIDVDIVEYTNYRRATGVNIRVKVN